MRSSSSPAFLATLALLFLLSLCLASETRPTGSSNQQPAYANNLQLPILNEPPDSPSQRNGPGSPGDINQPPLPANKPITTPHKCKTDAGSAEGERCGLSTPILKAQARRELSMGVVIPAVLGAAGVFAWGLL